MERKYVILADEVQIVALGTDLAAQGRGGWLAVMDGRHHRGGAVVLTPFGEVAPRTRSFQGAQAALHRLRAS